MSIIWFLPLPLLPFFPLVALLISSSLSYLKGKDLGCLDVYNCQTTIPTNIFIFQCHPGEPGCGSYNQEWTLASDGSLITHLDGRCVTAGEGGALSTLPCTGDKEQVFKYSSTDQTIRGPGGLCLTAFDSWQGNNITIQIYAKPLADGSVAVAVFNRATVRKINK